MINEELREQLKSISEDIVLFDNPSFDNSIIGISQDDRLIYDFGEMTLELSEDDNISIEEAIEFIDYNTIRALSYESSPNKPIVMFSVW